MSFTFFFLLAALSLNVFAKDAQIDVIKKIENEWAQTITYQSQIRQTILSKRIASKEVTTGQIMIQKPGKLRWESSDGTTQILNGKKVILIRKNPRRKTRTVDVYDNGSKQFQTESLGFLTSTEGFLNKYRALLSKETATRVFFRFKQSTGTSDSYIAEIDKSRYFLTALSVESIESQVRIEFFEHLINSPLSTELFDYVPEAGDIVHKQ